MTFEEFSRLGAPFIIHGDKTNMATKNSLILKAVINGKSLGTVSDVVTLGEITVIKCTEFITLIT